MSMSEKNDPGRCVRCGVELSSRAAEGLCAGCLLEAGLDAGSAAEGEALTASIDTPSGTSVTEQAGERIGRYKLLEKIGEGGMGVVWMAEQEEPVRRRVALKIIKLGMDTRDVVARFEAERQALALMDHPNIARVFDGGATTTGRPYFVMELVRGLPITKYCQEAKLQIRCRLELFAQVCRAVQHAHQKGIIHRDLKPSNILVTEQDGRPVPKVIDFGIAKATQGRLTDKTLFTGFAQLMGTPAYMSPEQAGLGSLDIDTRSDTYSLGVVLYELLTGRPPFDTHELLKQGYEAVLRTIREVDPPKPSTFLRQTRSATSGPAISKSQPASRLSIDVDLDWIVMKCLEKDRNRRYDTANALASDLQRYLANEPVLARPPASLYRFQKLVRRNKLGVAAAACVASALFIGALVATWQAIRATKAERNESRLRRDAETARAEEERARLKVEKQELLTRQNLYAADISLVPEALESGNLGRARALLEAHIPKDGQRDLRGFEWHYFSKVAQGDQLARFIGHSNAVLAVAFSPDGRVMVSGGLDGVVNVWDVATGKVIATLAGHNEQVNSVAFSPGGKFLATGGEDLTLLWEVGTQKLLSAFPGRSARAVFSPSAPLLAIGNGHGGTRFGESGGDVTLWNYAVGQKVHVFTGVGAYPAVSADGKLIATAHSDQQIRIWDVNTRQAVRSIEKVRGVRSVSFSPDGKFLVTSGGNAPRIFQIETGIEVARTGIEVARSGEHAERTSGACLSPDGLILATSSSDQTIRLWDKTAQTGLGRLLGHGSSVECLAFAPNGKLIASGDSAGVIMIWKAGSSAADSVIRPVEVGRWMAGLVYSTDGRLVAGTRSGSDIGVWEVSTGKEYAFVKEGGHPLGFLSDRNTLATASNPSWLNLWNLPNQTLRRKVSLPGLRFGHTLKMSPNGNHIAGYSDYGTAVWTIDGKLLAKLRVEPRDVAFSPDGQLLAIAGRSDRKPRVWDFAAQKELPAFGTHNDFVYSVAFQPQGKLLASGSLDGRTKLWDVASQREVATLDGYQPSVIRVEFAADGRTLAGADYRAVKLWNVATFREIATLNVDRHLHAIAFAPDNRSFVAADGDGGTLRLWRALPQRDNRIPTVELASLLPTTDSGQFIDPTNVVGIGLAEWTAGREVTLKRAHIRRELTIVLKENKPIMRFDDPEATTVMAEMAFSSTGAEAERLYRELLDYHGSKSTAVSVERVPLLVGLTSCLLSQQKYAETEQPLREYLGFLEKVSPDTWEAFDTKSQLGLSLLSQKKYAEAEALLLQGYQGMKTHIARIPQKFWFKLDEAGARIVQLYELWPKADQLVEWQRILSSPRTLDFSTPLDSRPARNPKASLSLIDLSRFYNASLTKSWHNAGYVENDLASLPAGIHTLGSTEFDVRGVIQIAGTDRNLSFKYPVEVAGIGIESRCRGICFLHGTAWNAAIGTQIGEYVITYSNNERETVPLVYGKNIHEWWLDTRRPPALDPSTSVAWKGVNPASAKKGMTIQLYKLRWENPRPDILVKSISFKSSMTKAAPFLVAITLEP